APTIGAEILKERPRQIDVPRRAHGRVPPGRIGELEAVGERSQRIARARSQLEAAADTAHHEANGQNSPFTSHRHPPGCCSYDNKARRGPQCAAERSRGSARERDHLAHQWCTTGQPPAMAPMIKNGSLPLAIASGSGVSVGSWERSSWQA